MCTQELIDCSAHGASQPVVTRSWDVVIISDTTTGVHALLKII